MNKVIEKSPDSIFYLLELMDIFVQSNKYVPDDVFKRILELNRTKKINPDSLYPLTKMPKNNPWVEKILKQNCLTMKSEKNKLSYLLNFRDMWHWKGAWERSWNNLAVYLGPSQSNIAIEVLQNSQ